MDDYDPVCKPLPPICEANRIIEKDIFLKAGRTGSCKELPTGWQSHPNCETCSLYTRLLMSRAPVHANTADNTTEYAFTLTMPPNYKSLKGLEEAARLICTNGLTNKPYEKPDKWAFVLEHTEAGTPHIHGMYKTPSGRRIAAKYFERYHLVDGFVKSETDKYFWNEKIHLGHGHRGGYHQKARHNESYSAYMTKEGCVHSSEKISLV